MPSSYPGRHMPLPILESSTSEKRWVSVANWTTPVGFVLISDTTHKLEKSNYISY
ncbi:hypothetical protein Hanom_Chr05g00428081 [Helianthus anomalus]